MQNDFNDDFKVTENSAAPLNWVDEANKDKIFSMRNFESDANIYINIKEVLSTGTNAPQQKIANFVKRITLMKQKIGGSQPPIHIIKKASVSASAEAATPSPPAINNVSGVVVATASAQVQRNSTANGLANMQNAMLRHNVSNLLTSPNVSVAIAPAAHSPISTVGKNGSNASYATVSSHALHAKNNSPMAACVQKAAIPLAPHTPSMQPTAYAPNASNAPIASNTPNVPQLLDLPARVRIRNRAYSVHYAPNEYSAMRLNLPARRQSIGDSLIHSNQPDTEPSADQSTDHTYTRATIQNPPNSLLQNGQRPPPPPYMTHVHAPEIVRSLPAHPNTPTTTLKVLTPDDLNSRK